MTDATGPRFDPRHDPLFQRGYDPAAQPAAAPSAPTQPQAAPPASAPPASAPPIGDPPIPAPTTTGLAAESNPAVADGPRRNPYIRALWIVGVGLLVGGIVLAWQATVISANFAFSGGELPFSVVLQQLVWTVVPPMVTVGIATIVALVFWEALRWPARQPDAPRS